MDEEVELLRYVDIEKFINLFECFFTQHRSFDYVMPMKRMVCTRPGFTLKDIEMSMHAHELIEQLETIQ